MPLSKQALLVENNTNFPNNNSGLITPELLRQFNTDMIDAMQLTQSMSEYAELAGGNSFTGNQTIIGNLNVSGVISASVLYVQTETASVIYSSGSNQFGDELIDVQTLSGSVKVQGSLTVNGVPVLTGSVSVDTGSLVTTASFNAYTQSTNLRLNSLETNSASVNVSISNLNTTTASLSTSITNINSFTQSQAALNGTFATTGSNTFTGNQIIDRASKLFTNGVYWTDPTAGFNNLEIINQGGGNLDFASLNGGRMRVVNTPLQLTGSALSSNSDISTSANIYAANLTGSGVLPAGVISSSAQITSLGFVSSSVTASSLITASFSGNTLTFTKGDSSTFGVVIPDVSGSTINTGSFATTGSNNFIGNQTITGSQFISGGVQITGYIQTGPNQYSLETSNGIRVNQTISTSGFNLSGSSSTEALNSFYPQTLWQHAGIVRFTNQIGGVGSGSIFITADGGAALNLSGSQTNIAGVNFIPFSASVNSRLTGFATTGSNIFTGDQYVSNGVLQVATYPQTGKTWFAPTAIEAVGTQSVAYEQFVDGGGYDAFNVVTTLDNGTEFRDLPSDTFVLNTWLAIPQNTGNNPAPQFKRGLVITGSTEVGTFTASLQQGYAWVGGAGNISTLVATSSFGGGVSGDYATLGANVFTGSQVITNGALQINQSGPGSSNFSMSGSQNNLTFTAPNTFFQCSGLFNFNNNYTNGGSGSLQFTAASSSVQFYSRDGFILGRAENAPLGNGFVRMNTISGSLVLAPSGFNNNAANLLHLSGSNNSNNVNLIFKNNNNTGDTIISGSNNIFGNPAAPTAGFKRYLSTGNINLTGGLPQLSGSMQFSPVITNNYLTGQLTMRGPVSSSVWPITSNNILSSISVGTSAANHAQGIVAGLTMNTNNVNGALNIVANRANTTQATSITGNQILGQSTTLNMNSSSILLQNNFIGGLTTITNNTSGSNRVSPLGNAAYVAQNIMMGGTTITASGSNDPNDTSDTDTQANVVRSLIVGNSNAIQLQGGPTGSNSLSATSILGNNLIVTGSSPNAFFNPNVPGIYGSAFVGRFNAVDGNRALSAQTVFAVGTGDTTTRKTGFLIDSGSNTFIEGTLNVSGSTTLSGSLYIQSASAFPTQIGTSLVTWDATTGQVGQATTSTLISSSFSAGEFYSMTTLSGSSGVSASIELPNTAISNGVSIQSNSQIVVQNTGVYNIQFSAQADAFGGADTIWIWFKKNGTNIADSASKLIMQNNTAAIMTVNIFDNALPNDYFEVVWQNNAGAGKLISDAATGNIPGIPSVIVTVNQVK